MTTGSTCLLTFLLDAGNHQGGDCSPGSPGGLYRKACPQSGRTEADEPVASLLRCPLVPGAFPRSRCYGKDRTFFPSPLLCCNVSGELPLWEKCYKRSQGCRAHLPAWQEKPQLGKPYTGRCEGKRNTHVPGETFIKHSELRSQ